MLLYCVLSPFVRILKTLSESHVYDFCMYVFFWMCCCCYFFSTTTLLYFTFVVVVVVAVTTTTLYIIRDDDTNEQLFLCSLPIVFFLFYFCFCFFSLSLSLSLSRVCACACSCLCHFFIGLDFRWFSPHLFRLTLVLTQYYLILSSLPVSLSLLTKIVSFFILLFNTHFNLTPIHLYIHTLYPFSFLHIYTLKTVPVNVYVYCYC